MVRGNRPCDSVGIGRGPVFIFDQNLIQKWTKNGQKLIKNDPKTNQKWPEMDQNWIENGSKMVQKVSVFDQNVSIPFQNSWVHCFGMGGRRKFPQRIWSFSSFGPILTKKFPPPAQHFFSQLSIFFISLIQKWSNMDQKKIKNAQKGQPKRARYCLPLQNCWGGAAFDVFDLARP